MGTVVINCLLSILVIFLFENGIAAEPSEGCKTATFNPVIDNYSQTTWKGRSLHRSMPRHYSPRRPTPLILAFHDRDQKGEAFILNTRMSHQVVNEEVIMVYPTPFDVRTPSVYAFPTSYQLFRWLTCSARAASALVV